MKKILSIFVFGIFLLSTIGALAAPELSNSNINNISDSITISKPVIEDDSEFVTVTLNEGNSYTLNPGKPKLPVVNQVYILPFGSIVNSVDVSYTGENDISLSKIIKPAIEPTPIGSRIKIDKDVEIYGSPEIFPKDRFNFRTGSGLSDGKHVLYLTVQCYPVWYNPKENILHYCDSIDIDVSYYEGKTYNSAMNEYDLVVISTKSFKSTIQKLIDHKISHGVKTFFKDVEEIYDVYPGRDKLEQIKYYVKDAIESQGISYVLIVGGINHVPIRKTAVGWHGSLELPTDLYFVDIYDSKGDFCTWDANNNNIFGEFNWDYGNIDEVDLYADALIGRIPCMKNSDLNVVINKIINYENTAYAQNWFNRILLLAGDTFPYRGIIEGEYVTNLIAEEMEGFTPVKLWTSTNNFNPLTINYRTTLGAGFISYSGHGYITGFGTSPPNKNRRIEYFDIFTIGMLNGKKLPIIFFDACLTATLDYKFFNLFDYPSITYTLLKKPFGGAIASIGATRVAFTDVDSHGVHAGAGYLNLHFFMNYEEGIILGDMLNRAKNDYLNYVGEDCFTIEEFIIIGDPSLKIGGYP